MYFLDSWPPWLSGEYEKEVRTLEYIVEMDDNRQLALPETVLNHFELKPGAHFTVRTENGRLLIEYLPFSSFDQAKTLNETMNALKE